MPPRPSADDADRGSTAVDPAGGLPLRTLTLRVGRRGEGQRVDRYLPGRLSQVSRTQVQAMMAAGRVRCDGQPITRPSVRLRAGMRLEVDVERTPERVRLVVDDHPLTVLWEDEALLFVSKPAGMATQPRHRFEGGTLVNAVLGHLGMDGQRGPRNVHRLDRDTSGVVVLAKTAAARTALGHQFNRRRVRKEYRAILHGVPERHEDLIGLPIGPTDDPLRMQIGGPGARPARTRLKVLESLDGGRYSLVALWPLTGRTHQLRVHTRGIGHPILADEWYGPQLDPASGMRRQALHAYRLTVQHPEDGLPITIRAPLPADMVAEAGRLASTLMMEGSMVNLKPTADGNYEITDGTHSVPIGAEKFEDLFFAVPMNTSQFYRLLTDGQPEDQNNVLRTMLDTEGLNASLEQIMADIAAQPEPGS